MRWCTKIDKKLVWVTVALAIMRTMTMGETQLTMVGWTVGHVVDVDNGVDFDFNLLPLEGDRCLLLYLHLLAIALHNLQSEIE